MIKRLVCAGLVSVALSLPAHSFTLKGQVSNAEGRVGIRISRQSGGVNLVHLASPAHLAGVQRGDIIVLVDGKLHNFDGITGTPGSTVQIEFRRGSQFYTVILERIDCRKIQP